MIYAKSQIGEAMFLLLVEQDVNNMRAGRTCFLDERVTNGATFNTVYLSLHKNHEAALEIIRKAGNYVPQLKNPEPLPSESNCNGCQNIVETASMFEGRCIVCWAEEAKMRRANDRK